MHRTRTTPSICVKHDMRLYPGHDLVDYFLRAIVLVMLLSPVHLVAQELYFPPPESEGGWRSLLPKSEQALSTEHIDHIRSTAGLDWHKLQEAWEHSQSLNTSGYLLIIRHGWIVGEWGDTSQVRSVASISKSLTALAMAKLFDLSAAGVVTTPIDPDSFAYHYLPAAWHEADPRRKRIQIKHLMTMSSGLEPDDRPAQPDYFDKILSQPVSYCPQAEWAYSSLAVDMLSMILQNVTGQTLEMFLNEQIHTRIGIPPVTWVDFDGYSRGSSGARYDVRNLARIGYLMLRNGLWQQESGVEAVVSAERVALITQWPAFLAEMIFRVTPESPFTVSEASATYYGYLWWTNTTGAALGPAVPSDAFYAHGLGERLLVVIPSLDMIMVQLGSGPVGEEAVPYRNEFMTRIMQAVVE